MSYLEVKNILMNGNYDINVSCIL